MGLEYPDGEQRPKRAYPLGSHPLRHLARTQGGGISLSYPDSEQCPKRGYPLGAFPLHHLARCNGATPPVIPPTPGGSGVSSRWRYDDTLERDRSFLDDDDIVEILAMIAPLL